MPDADREAQHDAEHQVTPLELFFDLTFVFAINQVTILSRTTRARPRVLRPGDTSEKQRKTPRFAGQEAAGRPAQRRTR